MEQRILTLFTKTNQLSFNEIEKLSKERSNKLAYHLKKLVSSGMLIKEETHYKINDQFEHVIPYLSEKKAALPVVLIHIGNEKEAFLIKRAKRPYLNLLSLPGGRIIIGESIEAAATRIMKEKYGVSIKKPKIKSLVHEHIIKNNKILHSFIIFVMQAQASVSLTSIKKHKKEIVKSDYTMIQYKRQPLTLKRITSTIIS